MKFETGTPPEHGYYVVLRYLCDRPLVLWWGGEWRSGCVVVRVDAWMGPLPERKQ